MSQTTERSARSGRSGPGGPIKRGGTYYRQVVAELRKVIWPTRNELVTYTVVSIFFVSAMIAIIAGFDFAFTRLVIAVFG